MRHVQRTIFYNWDLEKEKKSVKRWYDLFDCSSLEQFSEKFLSFKMQKQNNAEYKRTRAHISKTVENSRKAKEPYIF